MRTDAREAVGIAPTMRALALIALVSCGTSEPPPPPDPLTELEALRSQTCDCRLADQSAAEDCFATAALGVSRWGEAHPGYVPGARAVRHTLAACADHFRPTPPTADQIIAMVYAHAGKRSVRMLVLGTVRLDGSRTNGYANVELGPESNSNADLCTTMRWWGARYKEDTTACFLSADGLPRPRCSVANRLRLAAARAPGATSAHVTYGDRYSWGRNVAGPNWYIDLSGAERMDVVLPDDCDAEEAMP